MVLTNATVSDKLFQRAKHHMPLGVADSYRYWGEDRTVFIRDMEGPFITDVDGKRYVDFRLGWGPIILGYRDKRVDNAVIECIQNRGNLCGFSTDLDFEVANLMKELCPHLEKVRFTSSGTESVITAIRTARGFTGREKILMVEGSYHGLFDEAMWKADVEAWSPGAAVPPKIVPFGAGISRSTRDSVEILSMNDLDGLSALFEQRGEEFAAILIEPILGNCGSIEPNLEFLRLLRETCNAYGTLLIFDEVKTGFRVAKGGAQELFGIQSDLTTYAKAMGNGYPVAAFGGRSDVMDCISTQRGGVVHGGTYSANLIALTAARANLHVLSTTNALANIAECGRSIQSVLTEAFNEEGVEHMLTGHPSMFGIHFTSSPVSSYRDWRSTDSHLYHKMTIELMKRGVMVEPDSREPWFLCEAHNTIDLDWLGSIVGESIRAAKLA